MIVEAIIVATKTPCRVIESYYQNGVSGHKVSCLYGIFWIEANKLKIIRYNTNEQRANKPKKEGD